MTAGTHSDSERSVLDLFIADVMRTAGPYRHNPALAALGLCTELAELANVTSGGEGAIVSEAGDVLWHVVALLGRLPGDCPTYLGAAVDVVEELDAVKKAIAKGEAIPLAPVQSAVGYALSYGVAVDHILLYNMAKRHQRYPSASPEVVALLTEKGYL